MQDTRPRTERPISLSLPPCPVLPDGRAGLTSTQGSGNKEAGGSVSEGAEARAGTGPRSRGAAQLLAWRWRKGPQAKEGGRRSLGTRPVRHWKNGSTASKAELRARLGRGICLQILP